MSVTKLKITLVINTIWQWYYRLTTGKYSVKSMRWNMCESLWLARRAILTLTTHQKTTTTIAATKWTMGATLSVSTKATIIANVTMIS